MAIIHLVSGSRCLEAFLRRQLWESGGDRSASEWTPPGVQCCRSTAAGGRRQFLTPTVALRGKKKEAFLPSSAYVN